MIELPDDIINYHILPSLYSNDILSCYKGNAETGMLVLKDEWVNLNCENLNEYKSKMLKLLSLESQIRDIIQLSKVNKLLKSMVKNPLNLTFTQKINFAKNSLKNTIVFTTRIKKKLIYKIANRMKESNLYPLEEQARLTYNSNVKLTRLMLFKEMVSKFQPKPCHYAKEECLFCHKPLPLYFPSVRKHWIRSYKDKYNPKALLNSVCSIICLHRNPGIFKCALCSKTCHLGSCIEHTYKSCGFITMKVNPITAEANIPRYVNIMYESKFVCSNKCKSSLDKNQRRLNDKYVIMRDDNIDEIFGYIINEEIINKLLEENVIYETSIILLNPNMEDFIELFEN